MPRLTIEYDGGYVPKEMCTIDREGGADDCLSCAENCEYNNNHCDECPIQICFDKLSAYEDIGEPDELVKELPSLEMNCYYDGTIDSIYYKCPCCGTRREVDDIKNYCPECGMKFSLSGESIEQNGFYVWLPCKVGTKIWLNDPYWGDLCEGIVHSFEINQRNECHIWAKSTLIGIDFCKQVEVSDFGKTLFLSESEARKGKGFHRL